MSSGDGARVAAGSRRKGGNLDIVHLASDNRASFGTSAVIRIVGHVVDVVALKYILNAGIARPPVGENIVAFFSPDRPVIIQRAKIGTKHGLLELYRGEWLILVNEQDHPFTQRFTVIHEGWHILEQSYPQYARNISVPAIHEWAADRFAGAVLVPEIWVSEAWRQYPSIPKLAARFKVTPAAMRTRLRVLGYTVEEG